jgi:hypothetical protein
MFVNIFLFVIGGVIKDYKLYALLFLTFANLYILTAPVPPVSHKPKTIHFLLSQKALPENRFILCVLSLFRFLFFGRDNRT